MTQQTDSLSYWDKEDTMNGMRLEEHWPDLF